MWFFLVYCLQDYDGIPTVFKRVRGLRTRYEVSTRSDGCVNSLCYLYAISEHLLRAKYTNLSSSGLKKNRHEFFKKICYIYFGFGYSSLSNNGYKISDFEKLENIYKIKINCFSFILAATKDQFSQEHKILIPIMIYKSKKINSKYGCCNLLKVNNHLCYCYNIVEMFEFLAKWGFSSKYNLSNFLN